MTYLLIYGHPQCPLPVAKSGKKERHEGFRDRFGKLDDLSSPALRRQTQSVYILYHGSFDIVTVNPRNVALRPVT